MASAAPLTDEALEFFNTMAVKTFSEQAMAFLNVYWDEVGNQADYIFTVAYDMMKYADMHAKGISLIHKYEEGADLDFNIGLYFYEQLCKFHREHPEWCGDEYKISQPEMMTAIKRKKEIREKVDVNFDGRVSFLEVLLYQYQSVASPAAFAERSMKGPEEHPEIKKVRLALEAVNERIRAYEIEKARLEEDCNKTGIKGLKAKNELAQLDSSPLMEDLNRALITAEAALRRARRLFGGATVEGGASAPTAGSMWWMNKDMEVKKQRYGKRK